MAVTTVGDAASLTAVLRTAQAGDKILLAAGDYASVTLLNFHFTGAVTIASADPYALAVIHSLYVSDSSGLIFRDLELFSDPAGSKTPHVVKDSSDIQFEKLYVHGTLNGDPHDDTGGLQVRESTNISVTASHFEQLFWGLSHQGNTGLTVSGNLFHDIRMDGVRGGGSSFVTVSGNTFRDFHLVTGDHGDAVQFWTSNSTTSAHDIVVTDNVFVRGAGDAIQGVFIRDEEGGKPFENVTIRGNLLAGTTFHGISLYGARNVLIEDNVVQGFTDKRAWIRLEDVQGATLNDNASTLFTVTANSTDVNQTGSRVLGQTDDGGANALASWSVGHQSLLKLTGTAVDDVMVSGQTSSSLRGAEGNDQLFGGRAFDDLNGNQGNDTLSGGLGDDWVVGGQDNDLLFGDAGNDRILGNNGIDICYGGDGDDTLIGGQDMDVLFGGDGADYLSGDQGDDTMTGGAGADVFHSFGDAGVDRIADFRFADGDRVLLDPGTTYTVDEIGGDTVISMFGGGQVVLAGVALSTLPQGWILGA